MTSIELQLCDIQGTDLRADIVHELVPFFVLKIHLRT